MSNSRDILIASRDPLDLLVRRLNRALDLGTPLSLRTVRGEGAATTMSWEIAEGLLQETPITLMHAEGLDLDRCWHIGEGFWQRRGWHLSLDVRWHHPEAHDAFTRPMDELAWEVMTRVGKRLEVRCIALSNLQTPLGSYP